MGIWWRVVCSHGNSCRTIRRAALRQWERFSGLEFCLCHLLLVLPWTNYLVFFLRCLLFWEGIIIIISIPQNLLRQAGKRVQWLCTVDIYIYSRYLSEWYCLLLPVMHLAFLCYDSRVSPVRGGIFPLWWTLSSCQGCRWQWALLLHHQTLQSNARERRLSSGRSY